MANEQYLTEAHYLTCSKGAKPVRVSVDSQKSIKFSGALAATSKDIQGRLILFVQGQFLWSRCCMRMLVLELHRLLSLLAWVSWSRLGSSINYCCSCRCRISLCWL